MSSTVAPESYAAEGRQTVGVHVGPRRRPIPTPVCEAITGVPGRSVRPGGLVQHPVSTCSRSTFSTCSSVLCFLCSPIRTMAAKWSMTPKYVHGQAAGRQPRLHAPGVRTATVPGHRRTSRKATARSSLARHAFRARGPTPSVASSLKNRAFRHRNIRRSPDALPGSRELARHICEPARTETGPLLPAILRLDASVADGSAVAGDEAIAAAPKRNLSDAADPSRLLGIPLPHPSQQDGAPSGQSRATRWSRRRFGRCLSGASEWRPRV